MATTERSEAIRRAGLAPNMDDAALDRHCRIARAALDADAVLFSIVDDDRQFFPSHIGLNEPFATAGQTALSHSICQHVVSRGETLIVPDTASAPSLVSSEARVELDIAAYLGVPIRDESGVILGAVCSTSRDARDWNASDVQTLSDVGASIEHELQLRSTKARLQSRLSDDQLTQEYEDALSRISVATNRLQTIQGVTDELAKRVAPAIGAELTSIAIVDGETLHFTHGSGVAPHIAQMWSEAPIDAGVPMAVAVRTGQTIHLERAESFADYPQFDLAAEQLGLESFRAIPFGDESLGLFGVLGVGWRTPMADADVPRALDRVAELARTTLTRAWNFENERNQARILERVVLPTSLPDTSIFNVAGVYIAPDANQRVGGDVYDVIVRADGAVGVMIADAVGHDLTATRAAARLRHAIGVLIMENYSPAAIMGAVNRYVSASPSKRLVTCVCLLFAADGSSVTVANAGHPQPVLRSAEGAAFIGPVGESLLGRGAIDYSEQTVSIQEGDFVLSFTDGLIDRRGRSFIESEQWLLDFVARQDDHEPHGVTGRLHDEVADWVADDDMAFLVVSRRTPSDRPEIRWARPAGEIRLSEVRDEIRSWSDELGIAIVDDLLLAATELVTNARDASRSDDDIVLVLRQTGEASEVTMRVANRNPPFAAPPGMPEPTSPRGRGLSIVEAVSRSVDIDFDQGWVTVTAVFEP